MDECQHPEESREWEPGNYVAPYGWEIYPGLYCLDCGEMLNEEEYGPEPDYESRAELEDERRNLR